MESRFQPNQISHSSNPWLLLDINYDLQNIMLVSSSVCMYREDNQQKIFKYN